MMVLLTGITGLVGSLAAIALLRRGHGVAALARGRAGQSAEARARQVLSAHPAHGRGEFRVSRLGILEGDVTLPDCGLAGRADALSGQVGALVHAAAVVAFTPESEALLRAANVEGAVRAVDLAVRLRCPRFIHVGTAFVDQALAGRGFRTPYERSKWEGERAVRRRCAEAGLECVVVRPSIVTGDRADGFAPTFKGVYPFFRYGVRCAEELKRVPPMPCGVPADSAVNLVPGDDVAALVAALAEAGAGGESEVNVVNPSPWRARDLLRIAAALVGVRDPVPAAGAGPAYLPPLLARAADELGRHYAVYLGVNPELDTGSAARLRRRHGLTEPVNDEAWIEAMLRWAVRRNWEEL